MPEHKDPEITSLVVPFPSTDKENETVCKIYSCLIWTKVIETSLKTLSFAGIVTHSLKTYV